MNISALLSALPITGIEAQWLARIEGFVPDKAITLFEPPAGQHVPFIEAIETMAILLEHAGIPNEMTSVMAAALYAELRPQLTQFERPVLYNGSEVRTSPEYVPFTTLLDFLSEKHVVSGHLLTFLRQANEATIATRLFRYGDFEDKALRLPELPELPPPKAMIEFFVGLPDDLVYANAQDYANPPNELLEEWKAYIRPIADSLAEQLGEEVYYFADSESDIDDDNCHRFLALHCWCSLLPDSSFVRYLLEVTEFSEVEELKAALIDPAHFTHPWKMCDAFVGIDVSPMLKFSYLGENEKPQRVGIVFQHENALQRAEEIALQHIGCEISFCAPWALLGDAWIKQATRFNHSWQSYLTLEKPLEFLAGLDVLHVIEGKDMAEIEFASPEWVKVEKMVWRARSCGIELHYHISSSELMNPECALERRNIPRLVAEEDAAREQWFSGVKTLLVSADYGSSGIWDEQARNIPFEMLSIPFPLLRRIATWQRNHDDTIIPLIPGGDPGAAWWQAHEQERVEIAAALQNEVGSNVQVVLDWPGKEARS